MLNDTQRKQVYKDEYCVENDRKSCIINNILSELSILRSIIAKYHGYTYNISRIEYILNMIKSKDIETMIFEYILSQRIVCRTIGRSIRIASLGQWEQYGDACLVKIARSSQVGLIDIEKLIIKHIFKRRGLYQLLLDELKIKREE